MTKQNKPWQDIADAAGILRAHKQMELADRLQKYAEALAQPEQEPVGFVVDLYNGANTPSLPPTATVAWLNDNPKIGQVLYTTPPQRKPLTDEMVTAAARELNKRAAEACNVDEADSWNIYGDEYIEDARAVLEAAHSIKE